MYSPKSYHRPVLCREVVGLFRDVPVERIIDATLGDGGHSEAILEEYPDVVLFGIDRDSDALEIAGERLSRFGDRFLSMCGRFGEMERIVDEEGFGDSGGVLFDLGMSSRQIDDPQRGFSFGREGGIDMRMGGDVEVSAHEFINTADVDSLAATIRDFGEQRGAYRIAKAIVRHRGEGRIDTTTELARIVENAVPGCTNADLARVFQAIRIFVNDELEELKRGLEAALTILVPGGIMVVISYHSLEDRIVKRFMASEERGCICPPDLPVCRCGHFPRLKRPFKKPMTPSEDEIRANPRARSAKMRAAVKL